MRDYASLFTGNAPEEKEGEEGSPALYRLLLDAREKVEQGMTTLDEVLRVFGPQDFEVG